MLANKWNRRRSKVIRKLQSSFHLAAGLSSAVLPTTTGIRLKYFLVPSFIDVYISPPVQSASQFKALTDRPHIDYIASSSPTTSFRWSLYCTHFFPGFGSNGSADSSVNNKNTLFQLQQQQQQREKEKKHHQTNETGFIVATQLWAAMDSSNECQDDNNDTARVFVVSQPKIAPAVSTREDNILQIWSPGNRNTDGFQFSVCWWPVKWRHHQQQQR